jgi:hypothetical protein
MSTSKSGVVARSKLMTHSRGFGWRLADTALGLCRLLVLSGSRSSRLHSPWNVCHGEVTGSPSHLLRC